MTRTSDVGLLDAMFPEPLGKDVGHGLRREGHGEGELGVVGRHGGNTLKPCSQRKRDA